MSWRRTQADLRRRTLKNFDSEGADGYDALVGSLSVEDEAAYLTDLSRVFSFQSGMRVLDAGAGTGALCKVLSRAEGLRITALEPAPAMIDRFRAKSELSHVRVVEGFCDAIEDRAHFGAAQFDVIVSRQLVNGLYDPLTAFQNWHYWLAPGGAVVVVDGLYARSAWSGAWEEEIDVLPISACQTTALAPYLLERVGFEVESVGPMSSANELPSTRTFRYVVVGRKPQLESTLEDKR